MASASLSSVFRLRYVAAVVGIAATSTLAHGLIARTLSLQDDDARVVNVAGRQRMLSQRIPMLLLRRATHDTPELRYEYSRLRDFFFRAQEGLRWGDDQLGVPSTPPGPCRRALEAATAALVHLRASIARLEAVVDAGETPDAQSVAALFHASDTFLPLMHEAVQAFERAAQSRVEATERWLLILLFTTLVVLLLEVLLVFEPLHRLLRRQFRELEAAVQEARSATLAKSRFLATMTHELRTPLNGVVGMVEVLSQRGRFSGSDHECLEIIRSSSHTLLALISDILDFSKLESHRVVLEDIAYEPQRLCQDAISRHEAVALGRGTECALEIHPDAPNWAMGDPTRLRQIIDNLLSNAVKFTRSGHVTLGLEADSQWLWIRVEDTGIGIRPEARKHIFRAFSQADSTSTRRFGGTGLGLSIVSKLVEAMKGTIELGEGAEGGSVFTVRVPRRDAQDPLGSRPHGPGGYLRGKEVLIVDDLNVNLRILEMQLMAVGVSSVRASGYHEALRYLSTRRFDAILTDYAMPDRDGIELCRAVRGLGDPTPLLLLSSAPDAVAPQVMQLAGVHRRLAKPWVPDDLYRALAEALEGVNPGYPRGAESPEPSTPSEGSLSAGGVKARVLVVDDQRVNRMVAERLLCGLGVEVTCASGGFEALERLEEARFDMVLMDLSMPDIDGIETTRQLRERGFELPVVALTANSSSEDREACFDAGMNDFATKPVVSARLQELLSAWTGSASAEGEGASSST
ncbi:MAG: response regulator [Myxococcota bacterium]